MEKRGIRVIDFTKKTALFLMAVYFASVMIFSYKVEYFKISNIIFILFAGMVILYRIERVSVTPSLFYVLIISFLTFSLLSYYWAPYKDFVPSRTRTYFNLALLAMLILNIVENKRDLHFALKAFAISGAAMCIYTVYVYGVDNIKTMLLMGERVGAEINQENAFGLICGLSFVISASYTAFKRDKFQFLIALILAISILISGSRTSIITVILILGMIIFINTDSKKIMGTVAAVCVLIVVFNLVAQSEYFAFIFERFETFSNIFDSGNNMSVADMSTEIRFQMITDGLKWFSQNPIVGYGTQQYDYLYLLNYGEFRYAHNFHIQILVDHGIIGYGLIISIILAPLKYALSDYKKSTLSKIILLLIAFLIINGMGNQFMSQKVFWIVIGFLNSFVYIKHAKKIKSKTKRRKIENEDKCCHPRIQC